MTIQGNYVIKYKKTVVQHLGIIAIGALIFLIDEIEFLDQFFPKLFLIIVAVVKSVYFAGHSIKKIEDASEHNITYNKFLLVILINISLIIISFAIDYTCLYHISHYSFTGAINEHTVYNMFFDFVYFSILAFATVGLGDIVPFTVTAKVLVLMEVILSFFTIIVVISNFAHVKESAKEYSFLNRKKRPLKTGEKAEAAADDHSQRLPLAGVRKGRLEDE